MSHSIIHKYSIEESRKLQKDGEFPETINLEEENEFKNLDDESMIQFDSSLPSDDEESDKESDEENKEEEIDLYEI